MVKSGLNFTVWFVLFVVIPIGAEAKKAKAAKSPSPIPQIVARPTVDPYTATAQDLPIVASGPCGVDPLMTA